MKKLALLLVIIFFATIDSNSARGFRTGINFDYFYSSLSPYGEWIEIEYDVYVWRPTSVHYRWSPYSIGRWAYTSHGWYWDSYEPFGWATYHYGRWFNDDYYGWVWMPGYDWGPAWVEWRYNDAYIGWAPLPPYASFRIGVGIHFSINWHSHHHHWNFVTYNNFHHHHVNNYFVGSGHRQKIFRNTKYRTNYYADKGRIFNGGVDRGYIEDRSGTKFKQSEIHTANILRDAGRDRNADGRIEVFKPSVRDIEKVRGIDKRDITRAEGRTSLKTDKIRIGSRDETDRTNTTTLRKKSNERKTLALSKNEGKQTDRTLTKSDRNKRKENISKRNSEKSDQNRIDKTSKRKNEKSDTRSFNSKMKLKKKDSDKSIKPESRKVKKSGSSNKSYKANSSSKDLAGSKAKSNRVNSSQKSKREKKDNSSKQRIRR
ncbi:DUF6600 domain-containing protein [Bacteroidota bacterium]